MKIKTKLNLQRTLDGMEFTLKKNVYWCRFNVNEKCFLISWLYEHKLIEIHSGISGATWKSYLKRFPNFQELPRCSKKLWMTAKEKFARKIIFLIESISLHRKISFQFKEKVDDFIHQIISMSRTCCDDVYAKHSIR